MDKTSGEKKSFQKNIIPNYDNGKRRICQETRRRGGKNRKNGKQRRPRGRKKPRERRRKARFRFYFSPK
jgi:hypothetical protein